jgi:hypothetical protein
VDGDEIHQGGEGDGGTNISRSGWNGGGYYGGEVEDVGRHGIPSPVEYNGRSGEEGKQGGTFGYVEEDTVRKAIIAMSGKKAPGPDGIGASVIRLLWEWDSARITVLARASIRLGEHPKTWKIAKGVTIPKAGKDDYSKAKSHRVISLLNCLDKVVEKVVARMLTDHCE